MCCGWTFEVNQKLAARQMLAMFWTKDRRYTYDKGNCSPCGPFCTSCNAAGPGKCDTCEGLSDESKHLHIIGSYWFLQLLPFWNVIPLAMTEWSDHIKICPNPVQGDATYFATKNFTCERCVENCRTCFSATDEGSHGFNVLKGNIFGFHNQCGRKDCKYLQMQCGNVRVCMSHVCIITLWTVQSRCTSCIAGYVFGGKNKRECQRETDPMDLSDPARKLQPDFEVFGWNDVEL